MITGKYLFEMSKYILSIKAAIVLPPIVLSTDIIVADVWKRLKTKVYIEDI